MRPTAKRSFEGWLTSLIACQMALALEVSRSMVDVSNWRGAPRKGEEIRNHPVRLGCDLLVSVAYHLVQRRRPGNDCSDCHPLLALSA